MVLLSRVDVLADTMTDAPAGDGAEDAADDGADRSAETSDRRPGRSATGTAEPGSDRMRSGRSRDQVWVVISVLRIVAIRCSFILIHN
jgi:hypothetical protein